MNATVNTTHSIAYLNPRSYAYPMHLLWSRTERLFPKVEDGSITEPLADAIEVLDQLQQGHTAIGRLLRIPGEPTAEAKDSHDSFNRIYGGAYALYAESRMVANKKLSRDLLTQAIATLAKGSNTQRGRVIFDLDSLIGRGSGVIGLGFKNCDRRLATMDNKKRAKTLEKSGLLEAVFEGLPESLVSLQEMEILRAAIYMDLGEVAAAWFVLNEYEVWKRVILHPAANLVAECARVHAKEDPCMCGADEWHRAMGAKANIGKLKESLLLTEE